MSVMGRFITVIISLGFIGIIAACGIIVWALDYYAKDLPDFAFLKDYEPPVVSRVYAWDGRLMAEFAAERRVYVPINVVPDRVRQAFISAEDKNFYHHNGIDFRGVARAMLSNIQNIGTGRRPEGASTITQQVAKNLLLTNEVSYARKIREMILAFRMERVMAKDRILELYLNEIFLGQRSYGVGAAALTYFDKALEELSLEEAAFLAGLPKGPNNYHPVRKQEQAVIRRNWVIERMTVNGYVSDEQAMIAKAKPLEVALKQDNRNLVEAPYFAEEIRRFLEQEYGRSGLYEDGFLVRTSLRPDYQKMAETALRKGVVAYDRRQGWRGALSQVKAMDEWATALAALPTPEGVIDEWRLAVVISRDTGGIKLGFADGTEGDLPAQGYRWTGKTARQLVDRGDVVAVEYMHDDERYELRQIPQVQAAMVALDPHTGRVLAMQGGWSYGSSEFNRVTQAKRQPGSAFKPFVYLSALQKGYAPNSIVIDAPVEFETGNRGEIWRPSNYSNQFYGPTPIRVGIEKSRNLMTVRLANAVGMDDVSQLAEDFGIYETMEPHLANSLGSAETTVLDITAAYAMLVNGGQRVTPAFIDRIQDRDGKTVYRRDGRPCDGCGPMVDWRGDINVPVPLDTRAQIVDPRHAYQMVSILEGVVQRGTAVRLRSLSQTLAGKTGTTNESRDAWFVGFSPDLAVGVYVGFDNPRPLGKKETGSSAALPIFKDFMAQALEGQSPMPFRIPEGVSLVQINAATGARAQPGDPKVIWEAFLKGQEPSAVGRIMLDDQGVTVMPTNNVMEESFPIPDSESSITGTGGIY